MMASVTRYALTLALKRVLAPVREAAEELVGLQDPGHLYVRCVTCEVVR